MQNAPVVLCTDELEGVEVVYERGQCFGSSATMGVHPCLDGLRAEQVRCRSWKEAERRKLKMKLRRVTMPVERNHDVAVIAIGVHFSCLGFHPTTPILQMMPSVISSLLFIPVSSGLRLDLLIMPRMHK